MDCGHFACTMDAAFTRCRHVNLNDVLQVLSDELLALGTTAERMQTALGPMVLQAAHDPRTRRNAQEFDALTQSLHGLHSFTAALARSVPECWTADPVDATRSIKLADLARRLSLDASGDTAQQSGELDLF